MTTRRHSGPVLEAVDGVGVVACKTCGFKHVLPLPSPEELEQLYRDEYFQSEKPLYIDEYREDADWWNLVYRERYETFESLLPPKRRRLLDVGSGPGRFVRAGLDRGWKALGIEPSTHAAAASRAELGIEVVEGFFGPELVSTLPAADVVHLSEVLEHVPDPEETLIAARDALAPDGLLCVVVPNDFSPIQLALRSEGKAPWWVVPRHHLNYFDVASLPSLVSRCGFDIVSVETTFPIDVFLLMGDDYVGDPALGREVHARRKQLELQLDRAGLSPLKRQVYRGLADAGLGREVLVVARKY